MNVVGASSYATDAEITAPLKLIFNAYFVDGRVAKGPLARFTHAPPACLKMYQYGPGAPLVELRISNW